MTHTSRYCQAPRLWALLPHFAPVDRPYRLWLCQPLSRSAPIPSPRRCSLRVAITSRARSPPHPFPSTTAAPTRGSGIDLIDRGLERILSLRQALPRHRARAPQLYGLREKPALTGDERRRALTAENLQIFLTTFAQNLDGTRDSLEAGDIVLLQRLHGARRLLPAVVSDVVDGDGTPMVITLDPVDRVAREQLLATYAVEGHFRLHVADIERIRQSLDLPVGAPAGTPL